MGKVKLPIAVEEVVPHRSPMCLLRHVLKHDADSTTCDVLIGPNSLFLEKGRVDVWVGLEYMAQAVAARAGMVARKNGKPPKIGFWLGTRRASFFIDGFRPGQTLRVTVRPVWGEGSLFCFDGLVEDAANDRRLAVARLNVYLPQNIKRILKKG